MNIGSLYQVIWGYWLLFPTKEIISTVVEDVRDIFSTHALGAADYAAWYSTKYSCNVTWFSHGSFVVCLEEDGEFKKLLTSKGLIGWTQLGESYNKYFVEVKTVEQQTAAITRISLVG
jgi:hypothetical protein